MAPQTTLEIERVRYWQGQLLASGDLQTQLRVDEELRRLHNRAVHRAYGIAIGLGSANGQEAKLEEGKIKLPCGVAYDCAGRGLIVEEDRTVPLPAAVPDQLTLVLRYDPTSVDGIALTWIPAQNVNANTGIPITRLVLKAGSAKIDPKFRPVVARPLAGPRLATGVTIPGETAWKTWRIGEDEIGVQVEVDTSREGFTQLPHYFAEAIAGKPTDDFVPAWFASIANPSAQGFTLQLMLRRITRESLDIADEKVQVSAPPTIDNLNVTLKKRDQLFQGDLVARLLPIAKQASVIAALSGKTATLDFPLQEFTTAKQVAFGNPPRLAEVDTVSETPAFLVTTKTKSDFKENDVVVKVDPFLGSTKAASIVSIDDSIDDKSILEIFPPMVDLETGNTLAVVESGSTVVLAAGVNVTVSDTSDFKANDVVVFVKDPVDTSALARVKQIHEATKTLELFTEISGLTNNISQLQIAKARSAVDTVTPVPTQSKVTLVDNIRQYRAGDVVAKIAKDGSLNSPVRIKRVGATAKTLTLQGSIPGLASGDTLGAADFRVRATVLALSMTGQTLTIVTVADSTVFSTSAYVAKIEDDLLRASAPLEVVDIPNNRTLKLAGTIEGLASGDVIGLCAFPAAVKVKEIQADGNVVVDNAGLLHESDVVTAMPALTKHTAMALVADITGNVVRLTQRIPDLAGGDQLSVATVRGVIEVTPAPTSAPSSPKVTVADQSRVRIGDFLADITGWLQPRPGNSSVIDGVSDNQITLSARLDGLLKNDTIGLASLVPPLFQFRLNKMPDLRPGDEVLMVGLDRLQNFTRSMFATVVMTPPSSKLVLLVPEVTQGDFTLRPEDLSASVLFVRGSALDLIRKHDLFVSWLAVGDSDSMPKRCAGIDVPDCACTVKE